MVAITGTELQDWVEETSRGWKRLLLAHPEILSFPCDIRETRSVAELLQHVVAVELRYAERLNELAETPYESIPYDSVQLIYATHDRAMELLRRAAATGYRNSSAFRTESALAPLYGRPDFRLLMMDLAMPSEPFASWHAAGPAASSSINQASRL